MNTVGGFINPDTSSQCLSAGSGPAASTFFLSRQKEGAKKKATASHSPTGSRDAGTADGKRANSLRSNMRVSYPSAVPASRLCP